MKHTFLLFSILALFAVKGQTQTNIADSNSNRETLNEYMNLNNISVWAGWKLGNVIKVSGIIKYGNSLEKTESEKKYLVVRKIDEILLDSSKTIGIGYDQELFSRFKNNDTVTFLGYITGGYTGIPDFNDYDLEYWSGVSFHFELYFVVLKESDEIKKKE
ncbi:MAG: hypothetical protein V1904_15480 [Bacteroidota bacterium]